MKEITMSNDEGRLDRKRSFGTVFNEPNIGFEQDGKYFRHDGTLYSLPVVGEVKPAEPAEKPKGSKPTI
jgi:hypothetical protein